MTTDNSTSTPKPQGWGEEHQSVAEKFATEQRNFQMIAEADPNFVTRRGTKQVNPEIAQQIKDLMVADGMVGGFSARYVEKVIFGVHLSWLGQLIGSCFKAGTLIQMEDGSLKSIESIKVNDRVITAEGHCFPVVNTMVRRANESMFEVKICGEIPLELTGEHPILTKNGYIKANELKVGDMVWQPRYVSKETIKVLQTAGHIAIGKKAMVVAGYDYKFNDGGYQIPDLIDLDEEFGRFIGLFLAEGCVDQNNKTCFTFGKDCLESAMFVKEWLEKLGFNPKLIDHTHRGIWRVHLNSRRFTCFILSLCGKLAHGKQLHSDLMNSPQLFLKAVLKGWLEGDGHQKKNGKQIQGTTVSRILARQMASIILGLGLPLRINTQEGKPSGNVKSRKRRYDIFTSSTLESEIQRETESWRVENVEGGIWRRVMNISSTPFIGPVYNFEVAVDNSYIANGIGVHNCVASGGMRMMARRTLIEVFLLNDPEDIFGTTIVGTNNIAPFGPYSYRAGRRLANMNSGDGSYCSVHVKGANQFGILPCSTPGLVSDAFPEPQDMSLYRKWGNVNSLMDQFSDTAKLYRLLETELIKDVDQAKIVLIEQKKPLMICSMWAFRPDYQHPTWKLADGKPVWIYKRDTSTSWAHNMSVDGIITGPDNKEYVLIENSWGMNAHKNGPYFIIPISVYDAWCKNSEQQSIGEIDLVNTLPAPLV